MLEKTEASEINLWPGIIEKISQAASYSFLSCLGIKSQLIEIEAPPTRVTARTDVAKGVVP